MAWATSCACDWCFVTRRKKIAQTRDENQQKQVDYTRARSLPPFVCSEGSGLFFSGQIIPGRIGDKARQPNETKTKVGSDDVGPKEEVTHSHSVALTQQPSTSLASSHHPAPDCLVGRPTRPDPAPSRLGEPLTPAACQGPFH